MKIIKRDGRVKGFDLERIIKVIQLAVADRNKNFAGEAQINITAVANRVVNEVRRIKINQEDHIEVDDIQDKIVSVLGECDTVVAKCFKEYRDMREKARITDYHMKLKRDIFDKISDENSNANVDENNYGGKELRIVESITESMANNMLPPRLLELSRRGRVLKQHDWSKFAIGMHNCSLPDYTKLLTNGFATRQGDAKGANGYLCACQLIPVILQTQSLEQFGGVGLVNFSLYMVPWLKKSVTKHVIDIASVLLGEDEESIKEFKYRHGIAAKGAELRIKEAIEILSLEFGETTANSFARKLYREMEQAAQSLITNLVTLQSRSGHQLPFSSLNLGLIDPENPDESEAIIETFLKELHKGIGRHNRTAAFPITCFQVKAGVNKYPADPYWHLRMLAQRVANDRLFPTFVNCDYSQNKATCPDEEMNMMGCRTMMIYNVITGDYKKTGRGNNAPCTLNLPYIRLLHRDLSPEEFLDQLDIYIEDAKDSLMIRYEIMKANRPSVAPFSYTNGTLVNTEASLAKGTVEESLKHNSFAIGYIGVAETCKLTFGKYHCESDEAQEFAVAMITRIYNKCKKYQEELGLNFGVYATPAEGFCSKARDIIVEDFGIIEGVSDMEYITNSHHCPVHCGTPVAKKVEIESAFAKMATAGNIFHMEINGRDYNEAAMTKMLDMALDADIPYVRFSHPVSTCLDCSYRLGAAMETCEKCGSENVEILAVITGYLSSDYRFMNKGKRHEVVTRKLNEL